MKLYRFSFSSRDLALSILVTAIMSISYFILDLAQSVEVEEIYEEFEEITEMPGISHPESKEAPHE